MPAFLDKRDQHQINAVFLRAQHTVDRIERLKNSAQQYPPMAEEVFKTVQLIAACADAFAHGANDVANVAGPFAAVFFTFKDGEVSTDRTQGDDSWWILAVGAVGITIGVLAWGHKIIKMMGKKYMHHTPARGFCVELSSAFVVLIGTVLNLPLSTTHCQFGAQTGVALASQEEGSTEAPYNVKQFVKIIVFFPMSMFASGALCAALFSFGLRAPVA